ncbi:gamma-glutamyltransferase family protein [Aureimonas fodinaquatilis]|uniref:Gamma-glutamyltransferase family protein n=2 Tax=Aureimonas fodinaquatilis TaxID=2565783 RepID=A0A5B0DX52_9HYPH|nr:gamma-glutamyltransferase family protein [Aureimonas fodinaquatilis]
MSILERGGNAFDAAAAGGFVLQIVEPHLNGPGGEVPILIYSQNERKIRVICGQGTSPAAATQQHFDALGLDIMPGTGLLPACVPGAFDAWMLMLRDYGTMSVRDVLAPAISYAENGFPLVSKIVDAMDSVAEMFATHWATSAAIYPGPGNMPRAGDLFRNPDIAATYSRIVGEAESVRGDRAAQIDSARRAWYQGFVAEAIDGYYQSASVMDSSGHHNSGLLSGQDLASWTATYEDPATLDYHGHTIAKCGAWSQGPVLLQQLSILSKTSIADMAHGSAEFVHTVVESAKLAFADREAWYGDSAAQPLDLQAALSDDYAIQRRGMIGNTASLELRPGRIANAEPRLPRTRLVQDSASTLKVAGVGEPTVAGDGSPTTDSHGTLRGDTCHIDVIDRWGNMVSATPSGGWFQASPVVPGLGFNITTRGQMFWLEPGLPSSIAPNRRPRTTLTPSMALRDGQPYLAWGTPGGDQQDQWSLLFLLHHLHHGMNLQEAIDAPAFHSEHWSSSFWPREAAPNKLVMEGRFSPDTLNALRNMGHDVHVGGPWSEGRLSACTQELHGSTRFLKAGANARGMQGYAAGR